MRRPPNLTKAMRLIDEREIESWQTRGLCSQVDPELFFPEQGQASRTARKICDQCPVTERCLAWALEHYEYGVWGGTTDRQRMEMRNRRPAA